MTFLPILRSQNENPFTLNFFSRFLVFIVIFQVIVYCIHQSQLLSYAVQLAISHSVAFFYSLVADITIIVDGNHLIHSDSPRFLIVDNECTGLMLFASVSAVIMSFKQPFTARLKMVLLAAVLLYCENMLRIAHLLFEVKKDNNQFEFYHLYVWQIINFLTALLVITGVERLFGTKEV
ncbi:archaeosortase/exosortase family protein [Thalassotalea piscium]|uniref:Exosortase/archaeosortase family protein n=1 Tax=Thalassotalea piscium TaxID=1230533 RepID=A0A7X0TSD2_9GAMM|nr:archaeosortase/exosortase family protein [Thalassotalea piscium]MBB6542012.1 exosortase/archaeosortase family protein [Thalassotalea piscium]